MLAWKASLTTTPQKTKKMMKLKVSKRTKASIGIFAGKRRKYLRRMRKLPAIWEESLVAPVEIPAHAVEIVEVDAVEVDAVEAGAPDELDAFDEVPVKAPKKRVKKNTLDSSLDGLFGQPRLRVGSQG